MNGDPPLKVAPDALRAYGGSADVHDKLDPPGTYGVREAIARVADPGLFRLLVLLSVVMFALSFMGEGVFQWLIEYFRDTNPASIGPASIVAPAARVLTILVLLVAGPDKVPRVSLIRCGIGLSGIFLFLTTASDATWAQSLCVFLQNVAEELVWAVASLYASEAFPTDVRATAASIVYVFASVGSLTSSVFVGGLMQSWGPRKGIYILASVCLIGFLVSVFLPARDMRGKSLIDSSVRSSKKRGNSYSDDGDEDERTSLLNT